MGKYDVAAAPIVQDHTDWSKIYGQMAQGLAQMGTAGIQSYKQGQLDDKLKGLEVSNTQAPSETGKEVPMQWRSGDTAYADEGAAKVGMLEQRRAILADDTSAYAQQKLAAMDHEEARGMRLKQASQADKKFSWEETDHNTKQDIKAKNAEVYKGWVAAFQPTPVVDAAGNVQLGPDGAPMMNKPKNPNSSDYDELAVRMLKVAGESGTLDPEIAQALFKRKELREKEGVNDALKSLDKGDFEGMWKAYDKGDHRYTPEERAAIEKTIVKVPVLGLNGKPQVDAKGNPLRVTYQMTLPDGHVVNAHAELMKDLDIDKQTKLLVDIQDSNTKLIAAETGLKRAHNSATASAGDKPEGLATIGGQQVPVYSRKGFKGVFSYDADGKEVAWNGAYNKVDKQSEADRGGAARTQAWQALRDSLPTYTKDAKGAKVKLSEQELDALADAKYSNVSNPAPQGMTPPAAGGKESPMDQAKRLVSAGKISKEEANARLKAAGLPPI